MTCQYIYSHCISTTVYKIFSIRKAFEKFKVHDNNKTNK